MSFDQQMGQVRPIHDAAARLRLVKNSLSDLEVEGVTIAGSTAVYLHAFAQESGVPPHEVAYLLCDVTFPKEYIGILMLTPGSLQHKVTKIEKLKLELKRADRTLFTIVAITGLLKTSTLVDDHGEEYKVLEGIHLVINMIHAYHVTKSTWHDQSSQEMKKNTTMVFALMLNCIHSLIFAGCPSLQYGFVVSKETQTLSLDQKQRLLILSDGKIQSASAALRWFGANSPLEERTKNKKHACSIEDVNKYVYPIFARPRANDIPHPLHNSLEDLQKVIRQLVPTAHSLEHRTSMPSAILSSFTPMPRQQLRWNRI